MPNHWMLSLLFSACISILIHDGEAGRSSFSKFIGDTSAGTPGDDDLFRPGASLDNRHAGVPKSSQIFYTDSLTSDSWPRRSSFSSEYGSSSPDYVEDNTGSDGWSPQQSFGGDFDARFLANQYRDNSNYPSKRSGHQLSIVNPLDVLRQNLMLEMVRRERMKNQKQIKENEAILKNLGKRSTEPGFELGNTRRKNQRKSYGGAQPDSATGEFDV